VHRAGDIVVGDIKNVMRDSVASPRRIRSWRDNDVRAPRRRALLLAGGGAGKDAALIAVRVTMAESSEQRA